MKKPDIKVIVMSDWSEDHLEGIIQGYLENNYKIHNSSVQFNSSTIDGVFIFIKGGENVKE